MLVHTVPVCPPSKHNSVYTTTTLNTITSDCCAVIGLTNKEFCQDPVIAEMMGTTALPWHCELVINDKDSEEGLPTGSSTNEEGLSTGSSTNEEGLPTGNSTNEEGLPTSSLTNEEGLPTSSSTNEEGLPTSSSTNEEGLPTSSSTNEEGLPLNSEGGEEESKMDKCSLDDVIMLQYTSGSTGLYNNNTFTAKQIIKIAFPVICLYAFINISLTGNPKGVVNTNKCVLHNLELVKSITKTNDQTIELSFLPHYHDFGLFCSYLQPLYCGATGYYMSPFAFVEEPGQWIRNISKFKATHSQAPNSALELVMREDYPKDIDLSSIQHISNGSEPIYPDTIYRFENELAPFGLKKNTVRAVYGLAEHTACVCGVTDGEDPLIIEGRISCGGSLPGVTDGEDPLVIEGCVSCGGSLPGVTDGEDPLIIEGCVSCGGSLPGVTDGEDPLIIECSCGGSLPGVTVRVVDPETRTEVEEGKEGEVWVNSPSKALGYWNNVQETQRMFEAELVNDAGTFYLRTGGKLSIKCLSSY